MSLALPQAISFTTIGDLESAERAFAKLCAAERQPQRFDPNEAEDERPSWLPLRYDVRELERAGTYASA